MRLIFTLAIACMLLGGTYAYTRFVASIESQHEAYQVSLSDQQFTLELTRTFTAVPGSEGGTEFPDTGPESIRVLFKGQPILVRESEVPASETLYVESIPEVELGVNELFVFARLNPPEQGGLAAMQVRVHAANRLIAESTFTSRPGSDIVYGTLVFESIAD